MKKLVKVTLAMTGISVFYIALSAVLAFNENTLNISLRTWADALGRMIAALVTPLLVIVTLALWVHGRARIYSAVKGMLALAAGYGYSYSLVYDHPPKNGACELYVLYKHTGDGVANDAIIDMYAVDNATKKVAASGRKHWSDVGTKEYREMTEGNR